MNGNSDTNLPSNPLSRRLQSMGCRIRHPGPNAQVPSTIPSTHNGPEPTFACLRW